MAWHDQHAAESFILHEVFTGARRHRRPESVLQRRKGLCAVGIHCRTGQFIGHKEMVYQNVYDRIDPKTGRAELQADNSKMSLDKPIFICPSTAGGKERQAMMQSPAGDRRSRR